MPDSIYGQPYYQLPYMTVAAIASELELWRDNDEELGNMEFYRQVWNRAKRKGKLRALKAAAGLS